MTASAARILVGLLFIFTVIDVVFSARRGKNFLFTRIIKRETIIIIDKISKPISGCGKE